jgi:hypothetical protein
MIAALAGNSTSDSLRIDTCSLLFVAASVVPSAEPATISDDHYLPACQHLLLAIDDGVSARKAVAFSVFNDMSCGHWLA